MNSTMTRPVTDGSARTSILRRLAGGATALAAASALCAALSAPAEAADVHPFPARTDLNGRQQIGEDADAPGAVVDKYLEGQDVPVVCQQETGGAIWDRTADDLWVPDEYVGTGVTGFADGVPRCDAGGAQPTGGALEGQDISEDSLPDLTGDSFVYVKVSEGTTDALTHTSAPDEMAQARAQGMAAGGYHFASPNGVSGAEQADYFIEHGGGWAPGQNQLPGALDLEAPGNPGANGGTCYGRSPEEIVAFVHSFADEYEQRTGTKPVIYTSASWWDECTGGSTEFGAYPLWVPSYGVTPGEPGALPAGWESFVIHQYSPDPDRDLLPGGQATLDALTGA